MSVPEDIRLSFDQVPEIYDRIRPLYPSELFDALFARVEPNPETLEMGPGTGQATQELLRRGAEVTATELGPHLAGLLEEKFAGTSRLTVLQAEFESAEVPKHSFDLVIAACAYHWITGWVRLDRPAELLRPGGTFAVIDVNQVTSSADQGYFASVQRIYEEFGQSKQGKGTTQTAEQVVPSIFHELQTSARYTDVELERYPWDQTYTAEQYGDLLRSYSGTQMMEEAEREAMVKAMIDVANDEFAGYVTRPLVITLTMASLDA